MRLYYEMLPDNLVQVLQELMKIELLNRYRLVGGTSLALQLGHRSSVDIDLFGAGGTPPTSDIAQELTSVFQDAIRIIRVQPQGITATIRGIKVDVYDWKVPFLYEAVSVDGLRLATIDDIFAFKCEANLIERLKKISQIWLRSLKPDHLRSYWMCFEKAFLRDNNIHYAPGKSWEQYCVLMKQAIVNFEMEIEKEKLLKANEREERIRKLIEQKRNKQK